MIKIAPSILSADFSRLGDEIRAAETSGAHMIHIDVMDGHFVPNITIGPAVVSAARRVTSLPLDVHLMITHPDKYIDDFITAGADFVTVHYEADMHLNRTLQHIREKGCKAGVSINPATPVCSLDSVIHDLDLVLIMTVNPGFGGQQFISGCLEKISRVKQMITDQRLSCMLEVDGGVKIDNARSIAEAGADILVMGSAFFQSGDYAKTMARLNEILGN